MFATLKNKIKEETGNEVPSLPMRQNSIHSRLSRGSLASISSIDELSLIEQKDAEINALRVQLNDIQLQFNELDKKLETVEELNRKFEKDNSLLEESLKVSQVQKDLICDEQDKIQNLQSQEISKLKSLLLFREQEALDRLSVLKQSQHQVENLKIELSRIKKFEQMFEEAQDELEHLRHEMQHEKNNLITNLAAAKEDNRFLKSRLEIYENSTVNFAANLPIDEKIETLLKERKLLNQLLEEAHIQLSDVKSTWSGQNLQLETQLSRLSRQVAEETGEKRKITENYEDCQEKLKKYEEDFIKMESEIEQRNSKIKILEDEIEDLSTTLKATRVENDEEVKFLRAKVEENNKRKSELTNRLSVSDIKLNEFIENAEKNSKSLEKEVEILDEKNKELCDLLEKERQEKRNISMKCSEIAQNEEIFGQELKRKRNEMNEMNDKINQLLDEQSEKESKITELYGEIDSQKQISSKYREQLQNLDFLENELNEKNKQIKVLNQRLSDMKKTLKKELKTSSSSNGNLINNNNSSSTNQNFNEFIEVSTMVQGTPHDGQQKNEKNLANSKVVMDEVNFKYLKHVIFKFLTSREVEARHLIRAVSTLLHLSSDEEKLLHDTLNWKMSWFGSKPDHGTGQLSISIPPGL